MRKLVNKEVFFFRSAHYDDLLRYFWPSVSMLTAPRCRHDFSTTCGSINRRLVTIDDIIHAIDQTVLSFPCFRPLTF